MILKAWGALTVLAVFAACDHSARAADFPGKEVDSGKAKRKFAFTYTAEIKELPAGVKKVALWIPVPQDSKHQKIRDLKFEGSGQPLLSTDAASGNRCAYWACEGEEAKSFKVLMRFVCERKEIAAKDLGKGQPLSEKEMAELGACLTGSRLVLVGDAVRSVAEAATGEAQTPQEISRKAYDYVLENMKYDKSGAGWGKGSTQWACDSKYGNCTDFHALFMSIAETKGLPARFEMGFPLPPDKSEGEIGGYHCWAKFYLSGVGWVPVDISEAWKHKELREYYYGNLTADRVQFTSGRDVNLAPRQAGETLNYFIYPYAEADGKPIAVEKAFAFKDVE